MKTLRVILILTILMIGISKSYADVEKYQVLRTAVAPYVDISKVSAKESATINVESGSHTGFNTTFSLDTNQTDDEYDFAIKSVVLTEEGEVSAYTSPNGSDLYILFANEKLLPTTAAVNDAKRNGNNNKNVIAYPVKVQLTNGMTGSYELSNPYYGECYQIKLNSSTGGNITHYVLSSPLQNTYNIGQDQAGTYKSTIYFSAFGK